jgi:hypothetical protein
MRLQDRHAVSTSQQADQRSSSSVCGLHTAVFATADGWCGGCMTALDLQRHES